MAEASTKLNNFSKFNSAAAALAADDFGTPVYVYDEDLILSRCYECLEMPNAYGLTVRYAMKANSNRSLLRIISGAGLKLDASSLGEVLRANMAGIPFEDIMLTTQEVYQGGEMSKLQELLLQGLKYNVCSIRQLELIGDFAQKNFFDPGIRIHPGVGSGETATRNTGDDYSCFGVHLSDIDEVLRYAWGKWIRFKHIHVHIGSGADLDIWRQNIDLELRIIMQHFTEAETVSFGGGLKEARMPGEHAADIMALGKYAKEQITAFYKKTKRKLKMEIEPGTFIVANSGYAVTRVVDKKRTARSNFIITDGGMEINSRPLLYGSRHPVYIISGDGAAVKSSEFDSDCFGGANSAGGAGGADGADGSDGIGGADGAGWADGAGGYSAVVAGKCCESGDCQTLDMDGHAVPRLMAEPEIGDLAVIGGVGAYCSSMAPFNYNSHPQIPEVLFASDGGLRLIRKRQTLEQILENEV